MYTSTKFEPFDEDNYFDEIHERDEDENEKERVL